MRSIDDCITYPIPIHNRGWTRNGFLKRNMVRYVAMDSPDADTPEKHPEKIDLAYFQRRQIAKKDYQVTLAPWSEG